MDLESKVSEETGQGAKSGSKPGHGGLRRGAPCQARLSNILRREAPEKVQGIFKCEAPEKS